MAPYPAPRGRPRLYLDDADRHRAFRERRQVDLDRGDIARAVLATPTPALIAQIAQLLMGKSKPYFVARITGCF